ncbi:related to tandem ph domain-containing protein-2 (tapp2) [Sporisorium reilianum SRZ2]|uniref:Related to tandem ph domain-containing protein-2 (Tapp2) n=1 Tax=Sporisorium reilianum (strain SRZ2) TaxID=999809 RepID=E6ZJP5_SPORE|nr:related to tandem ph domain-containing protein-2 (tapp2) [Sporisorium reilianum SRZ2]
MPSGSSAATASSATLNPVAAAVSPRNGFPDTLVAQPSSTMHATSRIQDEDLEADADGDDDEEDGDDLDGSEAQHNMINESTVKSGYLEKKGEKRKTWKKRWFVLRSSKLAYYKNEKEYQLLRFIDVGDIKTVASVELKKSINTFGIVTPKRTFYVRASSRPEMESWIRVLNEVMTQYAQSSTMTQEMAALELANTETPAPSSTLPQPHSHLPSSLAPSQHHKRSLSQDRTPTSTAVPIKIGIPASPNFAAPAQPRPIPGSAAFSPATATSDSETGAERYGLSYTSSTGQSIAGSPTTRIDPSQSFLLAGQSPGGGGGHTSGSELSDVGGHQRRPSAGYGSFPRQRSVSSSRRLASYSSGAADQPSSPSLQPSGGVGTNQVLSSSDEEGEDDWDEEEVADQAMPLPALGTSQSSQQQQLSSLSLPGYPQQYPQQALQGQQPSPLSISPLPPTASDLIRDPNKVITQGYLMKQSGRRKVWRKRWFVLTSSRLLYSRSHMDAKAHRQIPISSMLDAIEYEAKKASSVVPTSPGIGSPSSNPFGLESSSLGAFGDRDANAAFSPGAGAPAGPPEKPERRGSMVAAAAGVASNMTAGMVGGSKKRKENCFQIITPKRTFILCAPGEDEEIKWISALKTLITRQRNGQTPSASGPPLSPTTLSPTTAFPFFAATPGGSAGNLATGGGGSTVTSPAAANRYTSPPQGKGAATTPGAAGQPTPAPGGVSSMGAAAQALSSTSLASASNQTASSTAAPSNGGNQTDTSSSQRQLTDHGATPAATAAM